MKCVPPQAMMKVPNARNIQWNGIPPLLARTMYSSVNEMTT